MLARSLWLIGLSGLASTARADEGPRADEPREGAAPVEPASEPMDEGDETDEEATFAYEPFAPAPVEAYEPEEEPAPDAPPPSLVATKPSKRQPPWTGERYRYGKLWLIPRGVLTGLSIPASIATWDANDVARFASVTSSVTALMIPLPGGSADARITHWIRDSRTTTTDHIFPKVYTVPLTIGIGAYTTLLSAGFFFFKRPRLREYVSLMLEALGVAQFYHVALKLTLGREGPYQGSREGDVYGPTRFFFPGGTPSGHTASVFAILVTAAEYFDSRPLRILCYLASTYFATSFLYNRQHFLSDVIWGAAIGDTVAKFVVRHRASDQRPGGNRRTEISISPMAFPAGGGLRLSLTGGDWF